jgi:hypothetical protein
MISTTITRAYPKRAAIPWKNNIRYPTELSSRPERSGVERSAVFFLLSAQTLQRVAAAGTGAIDTHCCFKCLFGTVIVAAVH